MHKYEQESRKLGKQSFMYAWVLDETGEERNRGITMDVGRFQFETKTKAVSVSKNCVRIFQSYKFSHFFKGDIVGRSRPQRLHPEHDIRCRTSGRCPFSS